MLYLFFLFAFFKLNSIPVRKCVLILFLFKELDTLIFLAYFWGARQSLLLHMLAVIINFSFPVEGRNVYAFFLGHPQS